MSNIPQYVCGVIPPHILTRVAERTDDAAAGTAGSAGCQRLGHAAGRAGRLDSTVHYSTRFENVM